MGQGMRRVTEFADQVTDWLRAGREHSHRDSVSSVDHRRLLVAGVWMLAGLGLVLAHVLTANEFVGVSGIFMFIAGSGYLWVALIGTTARNW